MGLEADGLSAVVGRRRMASAGDPFIRGFCQKTNLPVTSTENFGERQT
jgi:hypothetical protein